MELSNYEKGVSDLFEYNSNLPIGCLDVDHIKVVFKLFFKKASRQIRIVLNNDSYLKNLNVPVASVKNRFIDIEILILPESKCEFFVIDSKAFWYHDNERSIAFCNFNKPKEAKQLLKLFNDLQES